MLRLDDLVAIVEGETETKKSQEAKDIKETKATAEALRVQLKLEDLTTLATVDHYHNNQLLKWLKYEGFLNKVQAIYYCENSKDVIIGCNDHESTTSLAVKLMTLVFSQLARTEFTLEELTKAILPNKLLSSLLGFKYIPFEKDVFNTDGSAVDHTIVRLSGNIEFKLPYIIDTDDNPETQTKGQPHARKILYYILNRLEKGITREMFENPEKLPTLEELEKTLPNELPLDAKTLFEKYETLAIIRRQPSGTAKGFSRIMADNFEAMLNGLTQLPGDKSFIKELIEKLRITMPVVGIDATLLNKILVKYFGDAPSVRLGRPKTFGKQWLMPCELSIPTLESDLPEFTVMLLDTSPSMDGPRLMALKKAVNNSLKGLASRPKQKLSVISYDSLAYSKITFKDLNPDTLIQHQTVINDLFVNGSTLIVPALRLLKNEHLVEAQKCVEQLAPGSQAQLSITVLLVTDGEFYDAESDIDQAISELSGYKITYKCVALDLQAGGSPEKNLSKFVKDSEKNKLTGQQLIWAPCGSIDDKIRQLILGDGESCRLESIQVRYFGAGSEVLGSCRLTEVSNGFGKFSNLIVPRGVYEFLPYASQMGLSTLPMCVEFSYSDGNKKLLRTGIACDALSSPCKLAGFDKTYHIQNEFIKSRLLAEHPNGEDEKFDLFLKLWKEANEMDDKELVEEIMKNLQPFIQKFRTTFIECAYPSKRKKLQALRDLCQHEEASEHDLLVAILNEEIKKLADDLTLVLEDFLFAEAKVADLPEFEKKPLGEQLAAYSTLELKIKGELIAIPKGVDGKALMEQLTACINAIWHDATLCIEAQCNTMAEFSELPVLKRFDILKAVQEKANGYGKQDTSTQLQTEIDAIWVEATVVKMSEDQYDSLSVPKKLAILQKIKVEADVLNKPEITRKLESLINDLWYFGTKCQIAAIDNINNFAKLDLPTQLDALENLLQAAESAGRKKDIEKVKLEINPIWYEGMICRIAKIKNILNFTDLSLEAQLQVLTTVHEVAIQQQREEETKKLAARILLVKRDLILAKTADVKSTDEFLRLPAEDRIVILRKAQQAATDSGEKDCAEAFGAWIEKAEKYSDPKKIAAEAHQVLCVRLAQADLKEMSECTTFRAQIEAMTNMIKLCNERGDTEIAAYIKECINIDAMIAARVVRYVNCNKIKKVEATVVTGGPSDASVNRTNKAVNRQRYRFKTQDSVIESKEELVFMQTAVEAKIDLLNKILAEAEVEKEKGTLSEALYQALLQRVRERQCMCMGLKPFAREGESDDPVSGTKEPVSATADLVSESAPVSGTAVSVSGTPTSVSAIPPVIFSDAAGKERSRNGSGSSNGSASGPDSGASVMPVSASPEPVSASAEPESDSASTLSADIVSASATVDLVSISADTSSASSDPTSSINLTSSSADMSTSAAPASASTSVSASATVSGAAGSVSIMFSKRKSNRKG